MPKTRAETHPVTYLVLEATILILSACQCGQCLQELCPFLLLEATKSRWSSE